MSLVLTHARYQFLEVVRVPIAVIGSMLFPALSMIFFVVPNAGGDPVGATYATASTVTFAVMMTCLFQYGAGIAEDRAQPFEPYTRTLPAGPFPRFAGRLLTGLLTTLLSMVPIVAVAATLTEATTTPPRLLLAAGTLVVVSVPFTLMGLAIGYTLPSKAALAVAQVVFFPFAFGGGLMSAPGQAPGFVEAVAPFLPTRGSVELMWAAVAGYPVDPLAMAMLAVWIVATAALAVWGYRRDEGRRYT
ncbi:ABC transporter permease [Sinosporangium siamense]|uniref:ABC transporter n=1 Tax=Sinosporangium siamense TaxID=1367973 RepID=A0A919RB34_9ACTN|nr:ABC transporter permease [Sinosporangium siamense]GII90428.1 ABC transporter [Sinosporangium siamense]